jgi:hypothetical protein
VLDASGRQVAGRFTPPSVAHWQDVQEWLELAGVREAVVPFAEVLAEMMPDNPVRMRRDFKRLLHLVVVCALLHQRQRQRDGSGRVLAELADYAMAYELVHQAFGRVMRGVPRRPGSCCTHSRWSFLRRKQTERRSRPPHTRTSSARQGRRSTTSHAGYGPPWRSGWSTTLREPRASRRRSGSESSHSTNATRCRPQGTLRAACRKPLSGSIR